MNLPKTVSLQHLEWNWCALHRRRYNPLPISLCRRDARAIARRLDDMGILGTLKMIGYVALLRGTCRNERLVGPHSE